MAQQVGFNFIITLAALRFILSKFVGAQVDHLDVDVQNTSNVANAIQHLLQFSQLQVPIRAGGLRGSQNTHREINPYRDVLGSTTLRFVCIYVCAETYVGLGFSNVYYNTKKTISCLYFK